jgi:hypothetical protein
MSGLKMKLLPAAAVLLLALAVQVQAAEKIVISN